jgi:hypothetical protein
MKKKISYLTGLYLPTLRKETLKPMPSRAQIGKMLLVSCQAEMMPSVSISGTKITNQILQRLNGKAKKIMSYFKLSQKKGPNSGRI